MTSKRFVSLMFTLLVVTLCVTLVGCGDGGSASGSAAAEGSSANGFAGVWELDEMDDTTDEELQAMKDMGYAMFFVLGEDGSATYEFMGSAQTGTWEANGEDSATLSLDDDDDNWLPDMRLEDGDLVVESVDGGACTFQRISEDEHQAYNEEYGLTPETGDDGEQ